MTDMKVPGPDKPHKRFRVYWESDPGTVVESFDTLDEAKAFSRKQRSDRKHYVGDVRTIVWPGRLQACRWMTEGPLRGLQSGDTKSPGQEPLNL
jgi:hypothetical protein